MLFLVFSFVSNLQILTSGFQLLSFTMRDLIIILKNLLEEKI
jgi:hypothetical protein